MKNPFRIRLFLTVRFLIVFSLLAAACRIIVPGQVEESEAPLPTPTARVTGRRPVETLPPDTPEAEVSSSASSLSLETPSQAAPAGTVEPTGESLTPSDAVLAACGAEDQAGALRPQSELGTSAGLREFPFKACYELTLALQPGPAFTGSARVTFTNRTGSPLEELVFRLYPNSSEIYGGSLEVTGARLAGEPVQSEVVLVDGTALRLPLSEPLPPEETLVVELEFEGRTAEDFGGSRWVYGVYNYNPEDELLTLANWYPLLAQWEDGAWQYEPVSGVGDAVVSETALYRVQIQAPEGWNVATTGSALEPEEDPGGTGMSLTSGPVRDFMVVASPQLVESQVELDGILVRHWGLPEGRRLWNEALQVAVESLQAFNDRFGPYPYRELDVVAVPLQLASGVEYPGLILIEQNEYNAPNQIFLGIVVSHEVAHQWWYAVVGSDVLEHPWQDEALATYSSLVYQEAYQPPAYAGTLEAYRQRVERAEGSADDLPVALPVEAFRVNPGAYSTAVYLKGALFFVELREEIGDEAFFNALQDYYSEYHYKLAEPQDLLSAFEGACGCELDPFFAEWGVEGAG